MIITIVISATIPRRTDQWYEQKEGLEKTSEELTPSDALII